MKNETPLMPGVISHPTRAEVGSGTPQGYGAGAAAGWTPLPQESAKEAARDAIGPSVDLSPDYPLGIRPRATSSGPDVGAVAGETGTASW
jgi:hypothetical protein